MGDRKKRIRRMVRGLLKAHELDRVVKLESHPDGVNLVVEGCDGVVFSLQELIKERIDTYAALTYEDLKSEMLKFWKEILFVKAQKGQFRGLGARVPVVVRDSKGFASWVDTFPVKNMEGHP